jgi:hypothetical protein
MDFVWRHLPDLVLFPFVVLLQLRLADRARRAAPPGWARGIRIAGYLAAAWVFFAYLIGLPFLNRRIPLWTSVEWFKGLGLCWAVLTLAVGGLFLALDLLSAWMTRRSGPPAFSPTRRQALRLARTAAAAAPAAVLGYGMFIERHWFRTVEVRIPVRGLAKDLDGLRIVQLTDIHMGAFFSASDLRYSIDMANETKAHLALVTGDLINAKRDPLDECMDLLRGLKAGAGQLGCLGNHESFAGCENYTAQRGARQGLPFLRDARTELRFGAASINFAGVDYQPKSKPYLTNTAELLRPGMLNILLSHNPDVFPVAAAQGWDLTIAGHTHGGQITIEILGPAANPARFYTPYIYGRYQDNGRQIYVSRGLGTVGVPARLGAPPEVSLITLCAT